MHFLAPTSNLYRWFILVIVLVAFGLRAYHLDEQSLRGDEAASATYASFFITEIMEISRAADPHPPLFYGALHLWETLTGPTEFALRFWALLPGVLAVSSLYALVRRLIGPAEATLAALLLAVNSFHIWHSQDIRSYTWLMLLGLWASHFLWQALHRRRRVDWGGYTLTIALLLYLHYYALFLLVFHGLYVVCFAAFAPPAPLREAKSEQDSSLWGGRGALPPTAQRRGYFLSVLLKGRVLTWLGAVFLASLAFLPWLATSWQFVVRFTGDFAPALPHIILWRGLQAFSGGLVTEPPHFATWTAAAIFLVGVGIRVLWRWRRDADIFLLLYLGMPFAGIMLLSLRGQAFTERYLIGALPAYVAFVAVGLSYLAGDWPRAEIGQRWRLGDRVKSQKRRSWFTLLALLIIIAGNLYTLSRYHSDSALAKSPHWRQLFEHISEAQDPAADIVIYNFPEASITYYLDTRQQADDEALPAFLLPGQPGLSAGEVESHLKRLLGIYRRVWFIPVNIAGWDDANVVETWLMRHADRVDRAQFHWIYTDLYLTPAQIERSMTPQPTQFAGGFKLRGFQIFNPMTDKQIHLANEPLDLSLYWTADNPTAVPLTVFVQLIDSTGFLRGGQDNQPVEGSYPTTDWQPHELITDKYQVALQPNAPPGIYQIWVGLYNSQTGERVMILDDSENPVGDHIVLHVSVMK